MNGLTTTLLAQLSTRTTYELAGWEALAEWWQVALLATVCISMIVFVITIYAKDCVELGRRWAFLFVLLRLSVLAGALVVFLRPERRNEQPSVQNSRVLVLVDTSSSMAWRDADASRSRIQQVVDQLTDSLMLDDLQKGHDTIVAGFDADLTVHPLLPKQTDEAKPLSEATPALSADDVDEPANWTEVLAATGNDTRLNESLRKLLHQQRSEPVAAVIVMTDGGDTTDSSADEAIQLARSLRVPIFVVGTGTIERQNNVAISGVAAPSLVYPGDKFQITARVRSQGFAGRRATVKVFSQNTEPAGAGAKKLATPEKIVTLGADGEDLPVTFDITPAEDDVGRRLFTVEIDPFSDDVTPDDNTWDPLPIEIVERKLSVLLIAGGPTREYRFLRNQLRRDRQMDLVEWPQWADAGLTHATHKLVHEFPASLAELDEFDAMIVVDPDWQQLSTEQLASLERWVGNQAGGLIAIAGPIYTDHWTYDARMEKLRALYPVRFSQRFSLLDEQPSGSSKAWPLEFTDEGLLAKFLWLEDDAVESKNIWSQFEGVYGTYRVRGGELGAKVYALFTDPQANDSIYMAEHIYGAGRVFFLGSGEMWRLRTLSDGYFETFYTKLVRHVSQHRLNRQNSRGMLLVNRQPYNLGSTVTVRAQLKDERFEPLDQASVPLEIIPLGQAKKTLTLVPETAHQGMFVGEFVADQQGLYQLVLPVPGSVGDAVTADIRVESSDAETAHRTLNEPLLKQIASETEGDYYAGVATIAGTPGTQPALVERIADQTRTTYLVGAPDLDWQRRWMTWLLGGMCGLLCLEWTIRRLLKLA